LFLYSCSSNSDETIEDENVGRFIKMKVKDKSSSDRKYILKEETKTINDFFNSGKKNATISDFIKLKIGYKINYHYNYIRIKCLAKNISKRDFFYVEFNGLCFDKNKKIVASQPYILKNFKAGESKEFEIVVYSSAFASESVSVEINSYYP
jgi:hypothetical protein